MADPIVTGTTKLTTLEIDSLSPSDLFPGLEVYDLTKKTLMTYDGFRWKRSSETKNVVLVSPSGGDFTSIEAALIFVASQSPSSSNPYLVNVSPGIYNENPFTIPQYTSLNGSSGSFYNANNDMVTFITMSDMSSINGGEITNGPSTATSISCPDNGSYKIDKLGISDANIGISASGANSTLQATNITIKSNVTIGFNVETGATASISYSCSLQASTATIVDCNTAGKANISNCQFYSASTGINIVAANVEVNDVYIGNAITSIRLDATGSIIGTGIISRNASSYDIHQVDSGSIVRLSSSMFSSGRMNVINWNNVLIDYNDEQVPINGYNVSQGLSIGRIESGHSSYFGSGSHSPLEMQVWTRTSGGVFSDVTAAATNPLAGTFTFPGTGVDNAIYWSTDADNGSDKIKFFGIGVSVSVPAISNQNDILIEYWNGGSWVDVSGMTADFIAPGQSFNVKYFNQAGSFNIRFDQRISSLWVKNDPMLRGVDSYWIRFRINNAITSVPTLSFTLTMPNSASFSDDGWIQYFGSSRPLVQIPWNIGLLQPATSSPGNQDLFLSDELDIGLAENLFTNASVDRVGLNVYLPLSCDTSIPIQITWSCITSDSSAGNIDWIIRHSFSEDGDNIYTSQASAPATAPNQLTQNLSLPAPLSAGIQTTYNAFLDIRLLTPRKFGAIPAGSILWFTLERDGPTDTHTGNVALVQFTGFYAKWCEGGHF